MATLTTNLGLTKPELSDNLTPTIFSDAFDIIDAAIGFEVIGTLITGSTSVVLTDERITSNSTVVPFTDVYGVNPTDMVVSTGSVTLTFDAQEADLGVKVEVK